MGWKHDRQREEGNSCVPKNIKWIKSGTQQVGLDLSWDCTKLTGDSKEINNVQLQNAISVLNKTYLQKWKVSGIFVKKMRSRR
jgi:hypothetical protein